MDLSDTLNELLLLVLLFCFSLILILPSLLLKILDTVANETPASFATSVIVTFFSPFVPTPISF